MIGYFVPRDKIAEFKTHVPDGVRAADTQLPDIHVRNVFAIGDENPLRDARMRAVFDEESQFASTGTQREILLLARTGYSYLHPDGPAYRLGFGNLMESKGHLIRVMLEYPTSESMMARMRAAQDLGASSSEAHRHVALDWWDYKKRPNVDIAFTTNPIHCSLLITPDRIFYDPYHLGRDARGTAPGNDFLVFELERPTTPTTARDYYSQLRRYFQFLWNDYHGYRSSTDALRTARALQTELQHRVRYVYNVIEQHDTWLSVDPIVGCPCHCQYCFMNVPGWTAQRPRSTVTPTAIVETLVTHPLFVANETVLSFGNQTDAFFPPNLDYTLDFLRELARRGLANPIAIATKQRVHADTLASIRDLGLSQFALFVSYSGLPETIEPSISKADALTTLRVAKEVGVPAIHYWRPFLEENSTESAMQTVLDEVREFAIASVCIGLKLTPDLRKVYAKFLKRPLPARDFGEYWPEGAKRRLRALVRARAPEYPVYSHASCALALALRTPDTNVTDRLRPRQCVWSNCPDGQRLRCSLRRRASEAAVKEAFGRLNLATKPIWRNGRLKVVEPLTLQQFAYLLHRAQAPIDCSKLSWDRNLWGSIYGDPELRDGTG